MSPLIRAAGLQGYEALARSVGLDPEAELDRVNLSLARLSDPDALVPYAAMIQLLEHSAQASRCSDFGLRLSQMQDLGILGPVSVVVRHSKTLGEALQIASRYLFVQSPGLRFEVLPIQGQPQSVDLSFSIEMPDRPPCAQAVELALGVMAQGIRLLGQGRMKPALAQLPHARAGAMRSYIAALGCECVFERSLAALRLPVAALSQSLAEHDPMLQRLAQSYLDQNFGSDSSFVVDKVRILVRRLLGTGQASQANIASGMAVHPRTLQRQLKKEGMRFEDILDGIRREQLLLLFSRPNVPSMAQVAAMLGYSQQAVLTHSCRRWFGVSPSELRRRTQEVVERRSQTGQASG